MKSTGRQCLKVLKESKGITRNDNFGNNINNNNFSDYISLCVLHEKD